MLKATKLASYVSKTLHFLPIVHFLTLSPAGFFRSYGNSNIKDGDEPEHETEWERLLKPFDLKELRRSFHKITPFQLRKLLELPLDVHTSLEMFQRAGAQKGYYHSFDVYYALFDKLGAAKEFNVIDRLLLQMKEEDVVFRESIFILIMNYYGKSGFPGQATRCCKYNNITKANENLNALMNARIFSLVDNGNFIAMIPLDDKIMLQRQH